MMRSRSPPGPSASSSAPVTTLPASIPIVRAMAAAVAGWSPVTITTRTPAARAARTASGTSARGGSQNSTSPSQSRPCSTPPPGQRQHAQAARRRSLRALRPLAAGLVRELAAGEQHLGRALQVADHAALVGNGHAHELPRAVEDARAVSRSALADGDRIGALLARLREQPALERIARARIGLGLVREHHDAQRTLTVGRVHLAHEHAILGERSRLVGRDHRDGAQRLYGRQLADHGLPSRHYLY